MATVTTRQAPSWNLSESNRRVRHPLERLRSYIRSYVCIEGLAVLIIYVALWFWLGLVLDFGFFKAFGLDWVQVLPWSLRASVLALLVLGLLTVVTLKVVRRLFHEFRDLALALVMERRFPGELGDRLITAVELHDVTAAARFGYSPAMIEQTIHDAAERVERLPVQRVFNWKRLRGQVIVAALLALGLYLCVGVGVCITEQLKHGGTGLAGLHRFHDTAAIWFDRNILLRNTIWPRRAHLLLLNFPVGEELRIGRDAAPTPIRVRALRWVIADGNAEEGWRALTWNDLKPELLGVEPPPIELVPDDWQPRDPNEALPNPRLALTLDEVELQLDKPEVHKSSDTENALRGLLKQLDERAALPALSRRLRKLVIPQVVHLDYWGVSGNGQRTLQRQEGNEYSGQLENLRESIHFVAAGEDYSTAPREIIVVPPPSLIGLWRDEYHPAYIYYRAPRDGVAADLRGLKQHLLDSDARGRPVTVFGDRSVIDVPAGSDVVVTAKTDKKLKEGGVRILPPQKGGPEIRAEIALHDDQEGQSFQARFRNIRTVQDFVVEFTDTDNVLGQRHIVIKPIEDAAPDADVQVEGIRKTNQGYLCSVSAFIPLAGKVTDDHGLESVDYVYTLAQQASHTQQNLHALHLAGALGLMTGNRAGDFLAAALLAALARQPKPAANSIEARGEQRLAVAGFTEALRRHAAEAYPLALLRQQLEKPPPQAALIRDFKLEPRDYRNETTVGAGDGFDLDRLHLRVADVRELQPRYRMQLWVEATDNNIESDTGRGRKNQVKEQITFLLVSENELLSEVAKDEETLHLKLKDTVERLRDSEGKLNKLKLDLTSSELKLSDFGPLAISGEELEQTRDKCQSLTAEVQVDYLRLLGELRVNRVEPNIIEKVDKLICQPLSAILDDEFVQAQRSLDVLRQALDSPEMNAARKTELARPPAEEARVRLIALIKRLQGVLDSMDRIKDINDLIHIIQEIEKEERSQSDLLQKAYDDYKKALLEKLINPDPSDKKP